MTADRYRVIRGSHSGHCCFEATVVDTERPAVSSDGRRLGWDEAVCECFEIEDAVALVAVLNAALDKDSRSD